jgi:hypothetical protein
LHGWGVPHERGEFENLIWEYPLEQGLFLDFVLEILQRGAEPKTFQYGFEVKPKLWSIGQTLRQLKTYRRYFKGRLYLVAPPDAELARIVLCEGFGFFALSQEALK